MIAQSGAGDKSETKKAGEKGRWEDERKRVSSTLKIHV